MKVLVKEFQEALTSVDIQKKYSKSLGHFRDFDDSDEMPKKVLAALKSFKSDFGYVWSWEDSSNPQTEKTNLINDLKKNNIPYKLIETEDDTFILFSDSYSK